jgi:hypothetical protein
MIFFYKKNKKYIKITTIFYKKLNHNKFNILVFIYIYIYIYIYIVLFIFFLHLKNNENFVLENHKQPLKYILQTQYKFEKLVFLFSR